MGEFTKEQSIAVREVVHETLEKALVCADKHNIDRDSFLKYFAELFMVLISVSTFKSYKVNTTDKE